MADKSNSIQAGDGQVFLPQQLLQQPDEGADNTKIGGAAVGDQLVVALDVGDSHQ